MISVSDSLRPSVPSSRSLGDLADAFGLQVDSVDRATTFTGVVTGSADVLPGDLFVAAPGARSHGARYAGQATTAGAVAVLTDPAGAEILDVDPGARQLARVVLADGGSVSELLSRVSAWFHGDPAQSLETFAVTGTNGKTTTTYFIDHILQALGRTVGLIGTVEIRSGNRVLPSKLTTPDAAMLQGVFATMREDQVDAVAMEVSSHALVQGRVGGVTFNVAGFTNLTQDHLDLHGDLADYFRAKAELFTPAYSQCGVVVVDDQWGVQLAAQASVPIVTVSMAGVPADWSIVDIVPEARETFFTLIGPDGAALRTSTALPGLFNVANAALALVMLIASGIEVVELDHVLGLIGVLDPLVPGRMEQVATAPRVVVDFAHNPDALALALAALRPTTGGKLTVVFGATGERDTSKRPIMGEVSVQGADVVVVTDDDPHDEDAAQIRAEVLVGVRRAALEVDRPVLVLDQAPRASAIRAAILAADDADTILIAGRGHEAWQEIGGVNYPLDDRIEARAAVAERSTTPHDGQTKEHSE